MHEVEEEELLHESLLRDVLGDETVRDDDAMLVFSDELDEGEETDKDDGGMSDSEN